MARRKDVNTRIGVEVKQKEAENRKQFKKLQDMARRTTKHLNQISKFAKRVGLGIGGVLATATALYAKQEQAERKLRGALEETGQEVDRLFQKYKDLASELQATTTFGDEDLLGATSTLQRLAQISEKQMPDILELTADWATFLDKDVNSAARDVGRVMADPVKNLSLMGRYGIQINDSLKEQIQLLVDAGDQEKARLVVAELLREKVGGLAREIADTNTGKWVQLKNLMGDILEIVGERLLVKLRPLADWLTKTAKKILENRDAVVAFADKLIYAFQVAISAAVIATVIALLVKVKVGIAALGAASAGFASDFAAAGRGVKGVMAGMRTASRLTRVAFGLMWGGLTLGLSLAIPFIINNWQKIVDTFDLSGTLIASIWSNMIDNIMYRWESFAAGFERTWMRLKARFGMDPGEPTQRVRKKPKGFLEHSASEMGHYAKGLSYIWSDEYDPGGKAPKTPSVDDHPESEETKKLLDELRKREKATQENADKEKKNDFDLVENAKKRDQMITDSFFQAKQRQRVLAKQAHDEKLKRDKEAADNEQKLLRQTQSRFVDWIAQKTGLSKDEHDHEKGLLDLMTQHFTRSMGIRTDLTVSYGKTKTETDKNANWRSVWLDYLVKPLQAFATTYAAFGWPWGILLGAIAYKATKKALSQGLSGVAGFAQGGMFRGGVPGKDTINARLTPGELVTPVENYDEHVNAVANARDTDLAAGEGTREIRVVSELDGQVISETVTEFQKRNRAY